jgi:transposase
MEQQQAANPVFVGTDVSKDRLDSHLRPSGQAFAVAHDGPGLEELVGRLKPLAPALVVLETTGGLEIPVVAALAAAGLPVAVVNPRRIRHFPKAVGRLAKTDRLDAEIIALFAERMRPPARQLPGEDARQLAELVARRRQLTQMITAEDNRRRQARHRPVVERIEAYLK